MATSRSTNGYNYSLWRDIQYVIGEARLWPFSIRRLFWTRDLHHFDRVLLATFAWVNGLPPEMLYEWLALRRSIILGGERHRHLINVSCAYLGLTFYALTYSAFSFFYLFHCLLYILPRLLYPYIFIMFGTIPPLSFIILTFQLFSAFEEGREYRLYAYNVAMGRYE